MKRFGVPLAACCVMAFWPSAAHADPIDVSAAATIESTAVPGWQAFDGDHDANDGAFTAQAGLDNSVHFDAMTTVNLFDDRVSVPDVADPDGVLAAAQSQVALALNTAHVGADNGGDRDGDDPGSGGLGPGAAPAMPHGLGMSDPPGATGVATSATPEPASILLLATGLAGLLLLRRQLFA